MLLENQTGDDLLNIFIEHRKTALSTVINLSYSSVRVQISAMVRCLITTIRLLHECFICEFITIYIKKKNVMVSVAQHLPKN